MGKPIRIGVLGAGHLGRIHIQQWAQVEGATLIGLHDPDPARAALVGAEFGVPVLPDMASVIAAADIVDIVTPTLAHHSCAMAAIAAGKHIFLEKPIAHTQEEARNIIEGARDAGVKVQVGHVERFNPAFVAARSALADPMFIETHRLAQFDPRGTDVSVVLDLMVHDIDIVLHVVKSPLVSVQASGVAVVSDTPDIANARLAFANGCVANLTASRISLKKMRKSRFFQRDAYIGVDMLSKQTEIIRMRTVETPDPFAVTMDLGPGKGHREIAFDKPEVPEHNAIREELASFLRAVTTGSPVEVPGEDGAAALATAHRILDAMGVIRP